MISRNLSMDNANFLETKIWNQQQPAKVLNIFSTSNDRQFSGNFFLMGK